MRCPVCAHYDTKVLDSRDVDEALMIRRRRECIKCAFRFSTMEEMEILNLKVRKNDGTEQGYDKEKLLAGLKKALEKRPVTAERFRSAVNRIERDIQLRAKDDTIESRLIGEIVVKHLKRLDKVAYIRFASVYHNFSTVNEFQNVIRTLKPKIKVKNNK